MRSFDSETWLGIYVNSTVDTIDYSPKLFDKIFSVEFTNIPARLVHIVSQ